MTPDPASLTKTELLALARAAQIPGRSRMTKAELITALSRTAALGREDGAGTETSPPHIVTSRADEVVVRHVVPNADSSPADRRRALDARLAAHFDMETRCPWSTDEGFICGLPVIAGARVCALHGGIDIFDRALPLGGRLGFATWPRLLRHLMLVTYDTDELGLDPVVAELAWHLTNLLYFDYFRVDVEGNHHLPASGPAMLAANHGGAALPYDAFMLAAAVANEAAVPRRLRVIGTEIFNMLPFVSHLYRKAGGAYASREDAELLLSRGRLVGVFPEGEKGFMKPVWEAYQVQRFGRGGFLNLAERHGAPIVPVAIVGSEEVHPAVGVSETLARVVRLIWPEQRVDQMAVVLNPVPLPVRWHIRFLPPVPPEGVDSLRDPLRTLERTEAIRTSVQEALDEMVTDRRSMF